MVATAKQRQSTAPRIVINEIMYQPAGAAPDSTDQEFMITILLQFLIAVVFFQMYGIFVLFLREQYHFAEFSIGKRIEKIKDRGTFRHLQADPQEVR